jgi:hypothetical protein
MTSKTVERWFNYDWRYWQITAFVEQRVGGKRATLLKFVRRTDETRLGIHFNHVNNNIAIWSITIFQQ